MQTANALLYRLGNFLKEKMKRDPGRISTLLQLATEEPTNGNLRVRIGEIYEREGELTKSYSEFLTAAEIFYENGQYHRAGALYVKLLKKNPESDTVRIKIAEVYEKMGWLAQAFAEYQKLLREYRQNGFEDKALEILARLGELDPEKPAWGGTEPRSSKTSARPYSSPFRGKKAGFSTFFDLEEQLKMENPDSPFQPKSVSLGGISTSEEIFKELGKSGEEGELYPEYHYQVGMACKELGIIHEAIQHFRTAIEKNQMPIESENLLEECLRIRQSREEAKSTGLVPAGSEA